MTRIDSVTITLFVWDDTLGMRREVAFDVDLFAWTEVGNGDVLINEGIVRKWWDKHEERVRLALRGEPGGFVQGDGPDFVALLQSRDLELPEFHAMQLPLAAELTRLQAALADAERDATFWKDAHAFKAALVDAAAEREANLREALDLADTLAKSVARNWSDAPPDVMDARATYMASAYVARRALAREI